MKYIIKLQKGNTIEVTLPNGIKKKVNTSSQEYKDLYPNLTSKIDDNTYYKNLPEINVTSNKAGEHMVRKALNESGKTMMKGVGAAALVGTGVGSLITAPLATIGGFAGGMIGDYVTNKATQKFSGGKYQNWGEFAGAKTGISPEVMAFTNPGAIVGGILGSSPLLKNGIQSTGKYLINKAEPYLMGDKSIPMMNSYKPKMNLSEIVQNIKGNNLSSDSEITPFNLEDILTNAKKTVDGANIHGIYNKNNNIYLVKNSAEHQELLPQITTSLSDHPGIIPTRQSVRIKTDTGYKNIQLQDKAEGKFLHNLSEDDLNSITQEQINSAKNAIIEGSKKGLDFDFLNTKNGNILYDTKKGFQFIDLGTEGRFFKGDDALNAFKKQLKHGITKTTDYPDDYWLKRRGLILSSLPIVATGYGLTQSQKQGGILKRKNPNRI